MIVSGHFGRCAVETVLATANHSRFQKLEYASPAKRREEINIKKRKRGDEIKRQEAEHSFYYPICLLLSWNVNLFCCCVVVQYWILLAVGDCFCLRSLGAVPPRSVRPLRIRVTIEGVAFLHVGQYRDHKYLSVSQKSLVSQNSKIITRNHSKKSFTFSFCVPLQTKSLFWLFVSLSQAGEEAYIDYC